MQNGVISDNIVKRHPSYDDHSTCYSPQSARLDTSQLYGWLPYIASEDSSPGLKSVILFNFGDYMTIEGIDIQQGDLNDATLLNKIRFSIDSYWNLNTYIMYGLAEMSSSGGTSLVCFMFYLF